MSYPLVWIFIGVCGSGKTAVGRRFAHELECDFLEGDRRHSRSNLTKMSSSQPLEDKDRDLWLLEIKTDIQRAIDRKLETVITCSALKASYRKEITSIDQVKLVLLDVQEAELIRRLNARRNHYMKSEMLLSQMATFESIDPEEGVIILDGHLPIDVIVTELMTEANRRFPIMKQPWWQRQ